MCTDIIFNESCLKIEEKSVETGNMNYVYSV